MPLSNCPERSLDPPAVFECPDLCSYAVGCEATDYSAGCPLMEDREAEAEDWSERLAEDRRLRAEE